MSVESYVAPKGPLQCKRCQRFDHTQRNCRYAPRCVVCGGSHLSSGCPTPRDSLSAVAEGKTTQRITVAVWRGRKRRRLLQSMRQNAAERASPQANLPLLKLSGPVPLPSRWTWARGGITSSNGGVVMATTTPPTNPHPKSLPQPVTESPEKPIVTGSRVTARPQKPEPKSKAAPKRAHGKSKKKAAASVKIVTATPTTPRLVVPTQSPTSPIEEISDLLHHLPIHVCVELTRRLLMSVSSLPTGAVGPLAVMKTVITYSRIWQNAQGGLRGVKPCDSFASMRTECAAESLNWSIFSASTVSIFVS